MDAEEWKALEQPETSEAPEESEATRTSMRMSSCSTGPRSRWSISSGSSRSTPRSADGTGSSGGGIGQPSSSTGCRTHSTTPWRRSRPPSTARCMSSSSSCCATASLGGRPSTRRPDPRVNAACETSRGHMSRRERAGSGQAWGHATPLDAPRSWLLRQSERPPEAPLPCVLGRLPWFLGSVPPRADQGEASSASSTSSACMPLLCCL